MAGTAKLQLLIELQNKLNTGLDAAKKQVNKAVGGMQSKLDTLRLSSVKAFDAIKSEVPGLERAINMIKNPMIIAAAGAVALGTGFYKSAQMANQWQEQMAAINVTAEQTPEQLKNLSNELLKIGGRNVAPLEEVPKAFNRIISAGLSVNDSLKTLEPTLRAAKAGFTDVETVASAAVSVMMSSGKDANRVYDILFETVKEGNAEFKDIAQYLPKVIPMARNVGFELEETAGAFASLTGKLSAEQSTTALQGIMRALSDVNVAIGKVDKKTGKYISGFRAIGIDVFDKTTGKIRPVIDIVKDLNSAMSGLTDTQRVKKFDLLGLDQMGTIGFSTLMQDVNGLQKAIDATTNSQGALNKAYQDTKTPMDEWKETMNKVKEYGIRLGNAILPIITAIGKGALWAAQNIDIIGSVLAGIGTGMLIFNAGKIAILGYAGAMKIASVATGLFNAVMNISPLGWIATIIGVVITAITICYKKFDTFRAVVDGTWETIKGFGTLIKEYIINRIKSLISGLGTIGSAFQKLFSGDFGGAWTDAKKGFIELSGIDDAKKAFGSIGEKFNNGYQKSLKESEKKKVEESEGDFSGVPDNHTNPDITNNNKPNGLDDARKISSESQTKNITVNIDSFIKGFSSTNQTINNMNPAELERWLTEMFLRVVRSAEMTM
ncbi:MAG: phage tail tape measure protein [Dysgonamonadaceae bacterium]|jgi:TP901 family phage tail tape measure protein|nr:phage tail tape measure protein [Dysgonamonadaceae bacterium]